MQKRGRRFSYILLFVLSFSVLKNLLPSTPEHGDCSEFGHIHFHDLGRDSKTNAILKLSNNSGNEDDCHEGKAFAGYFILHSGKLEMAEPVYEDSFEIVFLVENNFKSPYLEPRRKPPRLSSVSSLRQFIHSSQT